MTIRWSNDQMKKRRRACESNRSRRRTDCGKRRRVDEWAPHTPPTHTHPQPIKYRAKQRFWRQKWRSTVGEHSQTRGKRHLRWKRADKQDGGQGDQQVCCRTCWSVQWRGKSGRRREGREWRFVLRSMVRWSQSMPRRTSKENQSIHRISWSLSLWIRSPDSSRSWHAWRTQLIRKLWALILSLSLTHTRKNFRGIIFGALFLVGKWRHTTRTKGQAFVDVKTDQETMKEFESKGKAAKSCALDPIKRFLLVLI